jgi:hypothetical protein
VSASGRVPGGEETAGGTAEPPGESGSRPDWLTEAAAAVRELHRAWQVYADGEAPEHPSTCRYCPLCRAAALSRSAAPDLLDELAGMVTMWAASLREQAGGEPRPPGQDGSAAAREPEGPHTERIEIVDAGAGADVGVGVGVGIGTDIGTEAGNGVRDEGQG